MKQIVCATCTSEHTKFRSRQNTVGFVGKWFKKPSIVSKTNYTSPLNMRD